MRGTIPFLIFLLICRFVCPAQAPLAYSIPGSVYTQNFDGLPNSGSFTLTGKGPFNLAGPPIGASGITGWQMFMTSGSNANAGFFPGTGSATGNGVYSLGAAGSTERALGSLSSSTGIYAMGLILTNQTGSMLNSFTISYTAEQWRKGGSTNKNIWSFHYKTGLINHIDQSGLLDEANLNFSSLITTAAATSLNGNLPENRQLVSYTVNNISWKPGEQLLLRWDDADEAGSDDVMALDNFSFSALLVSGVPVIVSTVITSIAENTATVIASVNDSHAITSLLVELDTSHLFASPTIIHPLPDTVQSGTGNTNVSAALNGLASGNSYYVRIKATNSNGTVTGSIQNFTTTISLPTISTTIASAVTTNTASLGGNITVAGGAAVTEKGIVWALNGIPSLLNNKVSMGNGTGNYLQPVTALPQGTMIYARAYAINAGGIAYGDTIRFATQTIITSLNTTGVAKTNAITAIFTLQTAQVISGLTTTNFSLLTNNVTDAFVAGVTGSGNTFTITVNTGKGSGTLGLRFADDNGLSIPINNKPFLSAGNYTIDKTAPSVTAITIPDKPMKTGDTIPVTVFVNPDADTYKMVSGNIDGFNLTGFTKKNDSVYTCSFIIANGGNDVPALTDIIGLISLVDSVGNRGTYPFTISQSSDAIDANKPFIIFIQNPPKGIYKAGDSLYFIYRFSEKIILSPTGTPAIAVTVGTRTRTALYVIGSGSDSLVFRYLVLSGDVDTDGIKTAGTITLNGTTIKDLAGNTASVSFSNVFATKDILIDGIIPVITGVTAPVAAVYKTGNILDFVVNYSKKVFVTTGSDLPSISIGIGNKLKPAAYINGSGSMTLLFRYTIQTDDMDTDGIQLSSVLYDVSASIKDSVGNRASILLNNTGTLTGIQINPPAIRIDHIIVPEDGKYKTGDTLDFLITYNETVYVTTTAGLPSVKIVIGSASKHAVYVNGTGSNALLFFYIIQPGDEDIDGIRVSSSISLNNGTIKDVWGNNAPAGLPALTTNRILIDAVAPVINTVIVPASRLYKMGDTLICATVFSEPVHMGIKTDTPFIRVTIGNADKKMSYRKGSGTNQLFFDYIVQYGDLDKKGLSLGAAIILGNSFITDSIGNTALVNFKVSTPSLTHVKIDAVAPVFTIAQPDTIQLCTNSGAVGISNAFAVSDDEAGELVTWKIKNIPRYGSLSLLSYAANSTGKNILPAGISYTPFQNQYGIDTVVTEITDGINTSQKTIILVILSGIKNNVISAAQIICMDQIPAPLSGTETVGGNGSYTYTWEITTIGDSLHFAAAPVNNNRQNYFSPALKNDTWFRRRIVSGACNDTSLPIKITVIKNGLWIGNQDHNWQNSHNWCSNSLPTGLTDVFIYAHSLYEPFITDSAKCNQLIIGNNAHVTITGILQLHGNISGHNGSVNAQKGTIIFSGQTPQNINGNLFEDLSVQNIIINNAKGVSLADDLIIKGNVSLTNGSLHTNNHLTLGHTAVIGASANGTSISGSVSLGYLIRGSKRVFQVLGNPFSHDMDLQMIKDSLDITGRNGSINGFTTTATNQPSAFYYDPLTGNDSSGMEAGWVPFTHTHGSADNVWKKQTGIRLLMRGRPGQGLDDIPAGAGTNGTYLPLPVMLKLSGRVNTGSQEILLQKDMYAGYHVIANPYIANIDLSRITRGNNIGRYYWLWNPKQGKKGGYTSFPFQNKSILPPLGAFIVKTNENNNNILLFTEHCKTAEAFSDSIPPLSLDDVLYVELKLETDSIFWDRILVMQMDSARVSFDRNDAEKFINSDVNFYSLSREQKMLSIDARPVSSESVIPIGIQTNDPGAFTIRVAKNNLPASMGLLLHDTYLNNWMVLEKDSTYHFITNSDTLSFGNKRFEIRSRKKAVSTTVLKSMIIVKINPVPARDKIIVSYAAPETGNTSIRILSLSGAPLKKIQLGLQKTGQVTIPVGDLLSGVYLLEMTCGNDMNTQKIIKD